MHRLFIGTIEGTRVSIQDEEAHHMHKVLRMQPGEQVELCDSKGLDYHAVIVAIDKHQVQLDVIAHFPSLREPDCKITLYQGLPKGTKMELIIQKCVELGVSEIVPVITARSVVKINGEKDGEKKSERWQKISEEAARQSKRGMIPTVTPPADFEDVTASAPQALKLMLWEGEREQNLRHTLKGLQPSSIAIMVGPEGGFDPSEAARARNLGWELATIGPRILRTETAGFVVLSAIMYQMEEMEWKKHP